MISDILCAALDEMGEYDDSDLYQGADREMVDDLIQHMRTVLISLDTPPPEQTVNVKTNVKTD